MLGEEKENFNERLCSALWLLAAHGIVCLCERREKPRAIFFAPKIFARLVARIVRAAIDFASATP
jgi:hypothetical protein